MKMTDRIGNGGGVSTMQSAERYAAVPDFVARFADAWDGKGQQVFTPYRDHIALLELARLPQTLHRTRWAQLSGSDRFELLKAARRLIELRRLCAWVFGEEQGAR